MPKRSLGGWESGVWESKGYWLLRCLPGGHHGNVQRWESSGERTKNTVSDSFHSGLRAAAGSFLLAPQTWGCFRVWTGRAASMPRAEGIALLSVSLGSSPVISCASWGFLCLQGARCTLHLSPLRCGLEPHLPICILVLRGKKTRPCNNTLQGLSAGLGVSPQRNVFLGVYQ